MTDASDASSPFLWPPAIYGGSTVVCGLLAWLAAWPFEAQSWRSGLLLVGVVVTAGGLAVIAAATRLFKTAGTAVAPTNPTTALVFDGIYRLTRNPMYLGMTLSLVGLGLALDQAWFLIAAPLAMFAVTKLAIAREETYLERKFGSDYLAYKQKVRRWI